MHFKFARLLVVAVGAVAAQAAFAADIPAPVYKAPPARVVAYNWTGFYVGGHIGGARSAVDFTYDSDEVEAFRHKASSWIGGGQVGYLHQFGNVVAGIEATYSATDLQDETPALTQDDRVRRSKISNIWTVVGRLGLASDRWLGYVKGGYANGRVGFDSFDTSDGFLPSGTSKHSYDGWTAGAGIEYAVWQNVSLALEYDFYRLDIDDHHVIGLNGFDNPGSLVHDAHADIHAVTARVNFRFGPTP